MPLLERMDDRYFKRRDEWFKLPLHLRQRWWTETHYGTKQPSLALVTEASKYADCRRPTAAV